ncbi:MAG: hypothetical protein Q8R08_00010 [bacterium]|nr:hypothetical protein [bacterium]
MKIRFVGTLSDKSLIRLAQGATGLMLLAILGIMFDIFFKWPMNRYFESLQEVSVAQGMYCALAYSLLVMSIRKIHPSKTCPIFYKIFSILLALLAFSNAPVWPMHRRANFLVSAMSYSLFIILLSWISPEKQRGDKEPA